MENRARSTIGPCPRVPAPATRGRRIAADACGGHPQASRQSWRIAFSSAAVETTVDVESKACPCCGGELHCIGEEVSKKLDVIPVQFRVLVVRRPKYARRACEDVVIQAPA